MRRGHKLNPDPEVSALRASVLEGARDQKAHACVDRGGVHWSPHYALMHGPSCNPRSRCPVGYVDPCISPQEGSEDGGSRASKRGASERGASAHAAKRAARGSASDAGAKSERALPANEP